MQHVNPDKLLYNFCDQRLSFEFKMKKKGIKSPRKDDLLFHKRLTFSHDRYKNTIKINLSKYEKGDETLHKLAFPK